LKEEVFSGLRAIFLHPLRSKSFPFLCKKENIERPRATFMPVFPPHFQPAESIRVDAGPRMPLQGAIHFQPMATPWENGSKKNAL
jgi:hypothetical protein